MSALVMFSAGYITAFLMVAARDHYYRKSGGLTQPGCDFWNDRRKP
jgi:hypothetical protein